MDEKRKLTKKEALSSNYVSTSSSTRMPLPRSFSQKNTSSKSNSHLLRSFSTKGSSSSNKSSLPRSCSQKGSSIGHKCSSMAKEQKARFYIMRRCVEMLVCWHKHGDS